MKIHVLMMVLILAGLATQPVRADKNKDKVHPDFTKGEKLVGHEGGYWNLGSTGATGWFWGSGADARQILIKEVAKGTPADGVLKENDVILGVGKELFASDSRKALANAIIEAEKKENGGKLTLGIWRPTPGAEPGVGGPSTATITLPVMGTYSATSPWECPKTTAIIENAAERIAKNGFFKENRNGSRSPNGGIPDMMNALGLLATGDGKYLPIVQEYARALGDPKRTYKIGPDGADGPGSWHGAYLNLFLTEYYLATKDEHVLPHIASLSNFIALGRSGVGTWSHGMADVKMNGFYGPPSSYGAMNQISITCAISLVLAQKCEIKNEAVDEAVIKATEFLRWYVDKGTIPYGDHAPAINHDNNGRNAQTAVLFDLRGEKKSAEFFSRSATASYPTMEVGHTGHFFSWLWGPLGVARSGEEAASSFAKNIRYFTEMERRADGGFVYQQQLGGKDAGKYRNWDTTGCRLLTLCLPRKNLHINGKGGTSIPPLVGADLETVVAAATFNPKDLSVPELLEALGSWSVVVRHHAAAELGNRDEDVVKELIAMLDSPNRYARYGACLAIQSAGRQSEDALKALIAKLEDTSESMDMRYYAIKGLQHIPSAKNGMGAAVTKAGPTLLKLAANFDAEQDPYGKLNQEITNTLFYAGQAGNSRGYYGGGNGIEKQDSKLVVEAMKAWLKNPNGGARSLAVSAYPRLTEDQLNEIWGEVYYAARNKAPSGVMFAGHGKAQSTILLAKHRIKEGLPIAVDYLKEEGWGKFGRVPAALDALSYYGSAAKEFMELMEAEHKQFQNRKGAEVKQVNAAWAKVLDNIDKEFELRSIEPYLRAAESSEKNSKKD